MYTTLPQSRWLEQVARGIPAYAESGVAGWLRDRPCETCKGSRHSTDDLTGSADDECPSCHGSAKKGSEWPSLVWWETSRKSNYISRGTALDSEWDLDYFKHHPDPSTKYVHALDYLDAFALLEDAGWLWGRQMRGEYEAEKDGVRDRPIADSPGELLDKIKAQEEKHG